jgi:hypothetical protein
MEAVTKNARFVLFAPADLLWSWFLFLTDERVPLHPLESRQVSV